MSRSHSGREDSSMQSEQETDRLRPTPMRVAAMRPENQEFQVAGEEMGGAMRQKVQPSNDAGAKESTMPLGKTEVRKTEFGRKAHDSVNQGLEHHVKVGDNRPTLTISSSMGGGRHSSSTEIDFGGADIQKAVDSNEPKQFEHKAEDFPEPLATQPNMNKSSKHRHLAATGVAPASPKGSAKSATHPKTPIASKVATSTSATDNKGTEMKAMDNDSKKQTTYAATSPTTADSVLPYYGLTSSLSGKELKGHPADYHQPRKHERRSHSHDASPEKDLGSLITETREQMVPTNTSNKASAPGRPLAASATGHLHQQTAAPTLERSLADSTSTSAVPRHKATVSSAKPFERVHVGVLPSNKQGERSDYSPTTHSYEHERKQEVHAPEMNLGILFQEDEQTPSPSSFESAQKQSNNVSSSSDKDISMSDSPTLGHSLSKSPNNNLGAENLSNRAAPASIHHSAMPPANRRGPAHHPAPEYESFKASTPVAHPDPMRRDHVAPIYHTPSSTSTLKYGSTTQTNESTMQLRAKEEELISAAADLYLPNDVGSNSSAPILAATQSGTKISSNSGSPDNHSASHDLQHAVYSAPDSTLAHRHEAPQSSKMPRKVLGKAHDEPIHQLPVKPAQAHHGDATEGLSKASFPTLVRRSKAHTDAPQTAATHVAAPRQKQYRSKRERKAAKRQEAAKSQSILDSISSALVGRKKNSVSTPVLHLNEIFGEASDIPVSSSPAADEHHHSPSAAIPLAAGIGGGVRSILESIHMPAIMGRHADSLPGALDMKEEDTFGTQSVHADSTLDRHYNRHEPSKAVMLKSPITSLSFFPEEQASYPRADASEVHQNPPYPKSIVDITEILYQKPSASPKQTPTAASMRDSAKSTSVEGVDPRKTHIGHVAVPAAAAAPMIPDLHAHHAPLQPVILDLHSHGASGQHNIDTTKLQSGHSSSSGTYKYMKESHSKAAMLKKPKIDLSLFSEEQADYPRGEVKQTPASVLKPSQRARVPIKEVQLDATQLHPHHDLHPTMTETAAAAVNQGIEGIKYLLEGIHLPALSGVATGVGDYHPAAPAETVSTVPAVGVPDIVASSPSQTSSVRAVSRAIPIDQSAFLKTHPRAHGEPLDSASTSANSFSPEVGSSKTEGDKNEALLLMHDIPVQSMRAEYQKPEHHYAIKPAVAATSVEPTFATTQPHSTPSTSSMRQSAVKKFTPSEHHSRKMEIHPVTEGTDAEERYFAADDFMSSGTCHHSRMGKTVELKTDPAIVLSRKFRPAEVLPPSADGKVRGCKGVMIAGATAPPVPAAAATPHSAQNHHEAPKLKTTGLAAPSAPVASIPIAQPPADLVAAVSALRNPSKKTVSNTQPATTAPKSPSSAVFASKSTPVIPVKPSRHHNYHSTAVQGAVPLMAAAATSVKPDEVIIMEASEPVQKVEAAPVSIKAFKDAVSKTAERNNVASPTKNTQHHHTADVQSNVTHNVAAPVAAPIIAGAAAIPAATGQDWTDLHGHQNRQHYQHQSPHLLHQQGLPVKKHDVVEIKKPDEFKAVEMGEVKMPTHAPAPQPSHSPSSAQTYATSYSQKAQDDTRGQGQASKRSALAPTAAATTAAAAIPVVASAKKAHDDVDIKIPTKAVPTSDTGDNRLSKDKVAQVPQPSVIQQHHLNRPIDIKSVPTTSATAMRTGGTDNNAKLASHSRSPASAPRPAAAAAVPGLATANAAHDPRKDIHSSPTNTNSGGVQSTTPQQHVQQPVMDIHDTPATAGAPAGYEGSVQALENGDRVIWVKKTYTTQEYYEPDDEAEDEEELDQFGHRKDRDVSLRFLNSRR
ncbi:hypothetical protein EDD11_005638 [Mortierella claussenii]|nr:hypothetical protein EDD11_005638 [Mortierella claussenii]